MTENKKVRKAVIPAAGLGTRYLPATISVPKEMIPVIDQPMIQLIVEEAVSSGIEEIILVTAEGKEAIQQHFGDHSDLISFLRSKGKNDLAKIVEDVGALCKLTLVYQKEPLGLGHAVLVTKQAVGNEPFAVLLGDDLIDTYGLPKSCTAQLCDMFEETKRSVVGIMEVEREAVSKYGIVAGDHVNSKLIKVKNMVEKPTVEASPSRFAIPGRYVLSPKIFKHLENTKPGRGGEIQLTDGLLKLALDEGLYAYLFDGKRFDVGDRIGMIDATITHALRRSELADDVRNILRKHLGE